jgi:hypothetical protein
MLRLWKRLCQRISSIQIRVYLAYLDLTPSDELLYEVKLLQYMFVLLVIPWLLSLCYCPIVVTVEVQRDGRIRKYTSSMRNFLIQTPSFAAFEAAMCSASIAESATVS